MDATSEQRKHPRRPLSDETIYFVCSSRARVYAPGTIRDISDRGIGLSSGFPHYVGEKLIFEGIEGGTGPQVARVVWDAQEERGSSFYCGLELISPAP